MGIVNALNNPKISDTIVFDLPCPDSDGCFRENPYKVDVVKIFYVSRDFSNSNLQQYDKKIYDAEKLNAAEAAERIACDVPTESNIAEAKRLRNEAESLSFTNTFYFDEASPIKIIGNSSYPAWLSTDTGNALISNVDEDSDGNIQYGHFKYEWKPEGIREGDYFVCWTWTMLPAGSSTSRHFHFNIVGNTQLTTSIPTHFTVPGKYETLLENYLPEMFKIRLCDDDKTPVVMDNLNKSVASGFTFLEDMANQLIDLVDSNATSETLLPLLANLFGLKLKTNDPTLWRRQIKQAVPLFKKKGTLDGLTAALSQAGIRLVKLTRLWQIISKYTWQESFVYSGTEEWTLNKVAYPIDLDNFGLWIKYAGEDTYNELTADYISFSTTDGVTTMSWEGDALSTSIIELNSGDIIKVLYKVAEVPSETEQIIENYIRTLPLMDQRAETDQDYPPKNWNVRALEEDDPLFDILVPVRHPYYDNLIWGPVRTEFPWSENVYNMDEYNASIRNSINPCDIGKDFVDPCSACLSSSYNIDLEIENLSNDRLLEAQDVLREFTPFHAYLHSMNFIGSVNEFIQSPEENLEILITYRGEEKVVAGEAQMYFNRTMIFGLDSEAVLRNELASSTEVVSSATGTAYNTEITFFSPDIKLERIGIAKDGSTILENLTSCTLAEISAVSGNTAVVNTNEMTDFDGNPVSFSQPFNETAFTFRLSNPVLDGTLCNIYQDNIIKLQDTENDFGLLGVKTDFDVENHGADGPWKVYISEYSATPYTIYDILPDGTLILNNSSGTLPETNDSSVSYTLITDTGAEIIESSTGSLLVSNRGRVKVLSSGMTPIYNIIKTGKYYFIKSNVQYQISGFVADTDDEFYIDNYSGGDMGGVNLKVYQRLTDNKVGYYSHRGMKLRVDGVNYESTLGIVNGRYSPATEDNTLENSRFKENFLVIIGNNYYSMNEIDGNSPSGSTTITLNGVNQYWKTFDAGGTSVTFSIYRYDRTSDITIQGQNPDEAAHTFSTIDRRGKEIVSKSTEDSSVSGLSAQGNQINEEIEQNESVTFEIEWADGTKEKGTL